MPTIYSHPGEIRIPGGVSTVLDIGNFSALAPGVFVLRGMGVGHLLASLSVKKSVLSAPGGFVSLGVSSNPSLYLSNEPLDTSHDYSLQLSHLFTTAENVIMTITGGAAGSFKTFLEVKIPQ